MKRTPPFSPGVCERAVRTIQDRKGEHSSRVAVTRATAVRNRLKTIADLKPFASEGVLGGPPARKTRQERISIPTGCYEWRQDGGGFALRTAEPPEPRRRASAGRTGRDRWRHGQASGQISTT